ncbi:Uncharacterised protein [Candidatus Anstonella stagnisolia]|nr:Uncharacterised protein [Candidatus Anstonella stagnisolia]
MTGYPYRMRQQGCFEVQQLVVKGGESGTSTEGSVIRIEGADTGTSRWIASTIVSGTGMKMMFNTTAASGDFAAMRIRSRADSTGTNTGIDIGASAGANNFGNCYGIRAYAQPTTYTNSDASNIVCGLYSCIQATASSSGRRWSAWIDDQSTTKAAGGHYLLRMSDTAQQRKMAQ